MTARPLRVLVVSMWPSRDAPERGIFVERQVAALRELGVEVEVVPLSDVRTGVLRTPAKYLSLAIRARRTVRRFRPDVVHGHFLVPTGSVARLAARAAGVPYVVTAHGTDVRNAEESPRVRGRTRAVVRDAAAVVAVSEALATRLVQLFPDIHPHVCDMGVDTVVFSPGKATSGEGGRRVVAVGSLLANKNHARLLRAVARVDDNLRAACVGEGPQRGELERLVAELGLQRRVAFAGRVPHAELAQWYRNVDAACLVSLDEGFGLTALEALACGCPVVVSRTAPVAALVREGVTGAIVDPLDVDDIARGLREVLAMARPSAAEAAAAVAGRSTLERARELRDLLAGVAAG